MDTALHRVLPRLLLLAAMAGLLLLLTLAPGPSPWSFALVGAGCLAALADGYAGVWVMLRAPHPRRSASMQLQACLAWLLNTLAYLSLLNASAELAVPGTFIRRSGPAAVFDVIYVTVLTFATGGYGDVLPGNDLGKLLVVLTTLGGLFYATLVAAAFWQLAKENR